MNKTVPNDIFHSGVCKCAYCGIATQKSKCIRTNPPRTRRFIFYCDEHHNDAERDILCVLKSLGYYRQYDVLKQPVFAVLPEDLLLYPSGEYIYVLNTSLTGDNIEFVIKHDDEHKINIFNSMTSNTIYVPVSLLKLSLPPEHHKLVDDLIVWLSKN
jgi:hypothetical protein